MAMDFIDGFDYLTIANGILKWDALSGTLVTGIFGRGKAIAGAASGTKTNIVGNITGGFQGFHYFTGTLGTGGGAVVCAFIDNATTQVDCRMDSTGAFFFTRNGTTIGITSTLRVPSNQWVWIEVQAVIHGSLGVAGLRINGTTYLSQTGLNTQATANQFYNKVKVNGNISGDQTQQVDSFHSWTAASGQGNDPSTFYGEHYIDTELATASGSNTQWNKGGSVINAQNFQQVNEANEDADTTYVFMSSSGTNFIDSYKFANVVVASGSIGIVAVNTIDRIDDVGPHTFTDYTKSGANTNTNGTITPGASYQNHQVFFALDPQGNVVWTITRRNAAEYGYKFLT